eukprot:scaffold233774_cov49-Attheya_sp.AAC.2
MKILASIWLVMMLFLSKSVARGFHQAHQPVNNILLPSSTAFGYSKLRYFKSAVTVASSSSEVESTSRSSFVDENNSSENKVDNSSRAWATRALLFSSSSDGLEKSRRATEFLKESLVQTMAVKLQKQMEQSLRASVINSPCAGPDIELLNQLEHLDEAIGSNTSSPSDCVLQNILATQEKKMLQLRIVYIPTAMYALRADSNNSAGKQRQRARADGKKRRNSLVSVVQSLFVNKEVEVLAVTLDLDDSSVKQPFSTGDSSNFPQNGADALQSWEPHLIYVEGGNTFWLQHCMDKGMWTSRIMSACTGPNAAVYCGKSAGAIVAGSTVGTATWKTKELQQTNCKVYALREWDVCLVEGEKQLVTVVNDEDRCS